MMLMKTKTSSSLYLFVFHHYVIANNDDDFSYFLDCMFAYEKYLATLFSLDTPTKLDCIEFLLKDKVVNLVLVLRRNSQHNIMMHWSISICYIQYSTRYSTVLVGGA